MLKVIKSGAYWKIKNTRTGVIYRTKYKTKQTAVVKKQIMKDWFTNNFTR